MHVLVWFLPLQPGSPVKTSLVFIIRRLVFNINNEWKNQIPVFFLFNNFMPGSCMFKSLGVRMASFLVMFPWNTRDLKDQ